MEASRSDTVQTSVEKSDGTTSENLECESEREDEEAYERKGGVPPESVMNEADALAVLATFSTSEYMLFLKKLAHNARPKERKWMLEMLAQFLTQRSPEENEDLMNAASGAASAAPVTSSLGLYRIRVRLCQPLDHGFSVSAVSQ